MRFRNATDSRIALVGAACRLPQAPDVDSFWRLISQGGDAIGEIPADRFDAGPLVAGSGGADPGGGPGEADPIASRAGGFLGDVSGFDAGFFRISPAEAARIDPQQRLLMEVAWEALEDAGIPADSLAGGNTGVYTGCLSSDYWDQLRRAGVRDLHAAMGSGTWGIAAGRIAHHLDLRGMSIGVEAACATSAVAIHLACRSLSTGESDLAVVGAVNLLLSRDFYVSLSESGILSPTGRSRFGAAGADGYVRSEGAVALVLKEEARALADGDRIYATILGSAVNNNGSAAGHLVSPGVQGQADVVRAACRDAGIEPAELDYVEAHGPGTPGGDLVEIAALQQVLTEGRPAGRRCLVGSVKSNIGHTEVAAGAAGLLKVALALHHRTLPPTLHVDSPQPVLTGPDAALELVTAARPWPAAPTAALAGVSSFGLSGTNTHVVLAAAPPAPAGPERPPAPAHLLPLSARDPQALRELADDYAALLDTLEQPGDVRDLCFSAGSRRTHHRHRLAVVGTDRRELADSLRLFALGERPANLVGGDLRSAERVRVVFVFSGHGAQWVGMARQLYRECPAFAARLHDCDQAVEGELGWSVLDRLHEDRPLERTDEAQPVLWAVQVSLAALLAGWGVEPDGVIGHSMGEVAAAVVSGALSLTDGAAVICRRSRLVARCARPGAMWAVQLGEGQAVEALAGCLDRVAVAAVNSSHSSVLSGDAAALEAVAAALDDRGVFNRRVPVDYASHAPQVEPVRDGLLAALAGLTPRRAAVPLFSTVAADRDGDAMDAGYWWENLRRPVRFADAVARALVADSRPTLFVELSPHPLLLAAVEDVIEESGAVAAAAPSLLRREPELRSMLEVLAHAFVLGARPDFAPVDPGRFRPLPAYPWQRRRAWIDAPPVAPASVAPASASAAVAASVAVGMTAAAGDDRLGSRTRPVPRRGRPGLEDVVRLLTEILAGTLGMPPAEVDLSLTPSESGLDSLLAVRVRDRLTRSLGVTLPLRELLSPGSMGQLAERIHRAGHEVA